MMDLQVHMYDTDFKSLCENATSWADSWVNSWAAQVIQDGRFEKHSSSLTAASVTEPSSKLKFAYWISRTDFLPVMFAREFVAALGYDWEIHWDLAEDNAGMLGWVILTDYDYGGMAEIAQHNSRIPPRV